MYPASNAMRAKVFYQHVLSRDVSRDQGCHALYVLCSNLYYCTAYAGLYEFLPGGPAFHDEVLGIYIRFNV